MATNGNNIKQEISNYYCCNLCNFKTVRKNNPDCLKSESKVSDKYNKLVFEAMGGKGDNESEKEDKIIKNIAKEVTIDKQIL